MALYNSKNDEERKKKIRARLEKTRERIRSAKGRKSSTPSKPAYEPLAPTSSLSEKAGRTFAQVGFNVKKTRKKLSFPGLVARVLTPEKTDKAFAKGAQQGEAVAGSAIQFAGARLGSSILKEFGKGYKEKSYKIAEKEKLLPTGRESKWEKLVMSAPVSLGGLATGAVAGATTGGAVPSMILYTGLMEAGAKYDQALQEGATDDQALKAASITGVINGALETLPGLRYAKKFAPKPIRDLANKIIQKEVKNTVLKFMKKDAVSRFVGGRTVDAIIEYLTEASQEVTGNLASKYVYNPDQDWKENVAEAGELGAYMGFIMSGISSTIGMARTGRPLEELKNKAQGITPEGGKPQAKVTPQEVDTRTSEIISKFKESQVKKEKEVVESQVEEKRLPEKPKQAVEKEKLIQSTTKETKPQETKPSEPSEVMVDETEKTLAKEVKRYENVTKFKKSLEFFESPVNKELKGKRISLVDIKGETHKGVFEKFTSGVFNGKKDMAIQISIDKDKSGTIKLADIKENSLNIPNNLDEVFNKVKGVKSLQEKMGDTTITKLSPIEQKLREGKAEMKFAVKEQETAYKFGRKEARQEITKQFRTKIKDTTKIRKDIERYAKETLPSYVRGHLLKAVSTAKTQKNLTKAFIRIDEIADRTRKTEIKKEIQKTVKNLSKAKNVDIDYRNKVNRLLEGIDLKGHNKKTISRLKGLKEVIRSAEASGKKMIVPKHILKSLKVLEKKPYHLLSSGDLQAVLIEMKSAIEAGKHKLGQKENLYNLRRGNWKDFSLSNVNEINTRDQLMPEVGKDLSYQEKLKNWKNRGVDMIKNKDFAFLIMDNVFDKMGLTTVKKKVDQSMASYLDMKYEIKDLVENVRSTYGIDRKSSERIAAFSAQEQGIENKVRASRKIVKGKILETPLTDNEKAYLEQSKKIYKKLHSVLAPFMKDKYNVEVGYIDNYSYFRNDFNLLDEMEVYKRFDQKEVDKYIKQKETKKPWTKKRTGADQKIVLDYHSNLLDYVDNVAYLVNVGEDIKMFSEIFNSKDFRKKSGDVGQKEMVEYTELLARKGGIKGAAALRFLDTVRVNVGAAVLGFKLSTVLLQSTALLDGAALIGEYAFSGMKDFVTSKEWRDFLYKNAPKLRERTFDDPSAIEFASNHTIAEMQKAGYAPMKFGDKFTAGGVTAGAYMKYLNEHNIPLDFNNPNKEAIIYAEGIMSRTQASAFFWDLPSAISRGGITGVPSLDKSIMQFQTFSTYKWNMYRYTMPGLAKQGDYGKMTVGMMWLMLGDIAAVGMRQVSKVILASILLGREEDKKNDKFWSDVVAQILTVVPFASQTWSSYQYGSSPFPVADVFKDFLVSSKQVSSSKSAESKIKGGIGVVGTFAKVRGIPGTIEAENALKKIVVPAMQ